jgi:hypothetical protein
MKHPVRKNRWQDIGAVAGCAMTLWVAVIATAIALVSPGSARAQGSVTQTLTWIAPGDDGNVGTAAQYEIRFYTEPIDSTNWDLATPFPGPYPEPAAAGTRQFFQFTVPTDTTYYIAIRARDDGLNWSPVSDPVAVAADGITVIVPMVTEFRGNYPNPFNAGTTIDFTTSAPVHVDISIYNLLGKRVRQLVNRPMSAERHRISWDGTDDAGNALPSGTYLYRIIAGSFSRLSKMSLLK